MGFVIADFAKVYCIEEDTQKRKMLYVKYHFEWQLKLYLQQSDLIILEQTKIGRWEFLQAPDNKKLVLTDPNQKFPRAEARAEAREEKKKAEVEQKAVRKAEKKATRNEKQQKAIGLVKRLYGDYQSHREAHKKD
jgi:hypothetical protein